MAVILTLILLASIAGIVKPYIGSLRRGHFVIAAVISFIGIGVTAPSSQQPSSMAGNQTAETVSTDTKATGVTAAPTEKTGAWRYTEDTDAMRGTKTTYAVIESDNEVDLDFPYGVVNGSVTIRKRPEDGTNVMFSVDKGQILCSNFSESHVSIRFDDGPIQRFSCTGTSDGSSETAFITNEARAIAAIRKADRMIVEAEFFQKGRQQFVFDIGGLKWN